MSENPQPVVPEPTSQDGLRSRRGRSGWIGGAVLIIIGLAFLAQNFGVPGVVIHNWWAVFLLIPAVTIFGNALDAYVENGNQFSSKVISSGVMSILFLGLAAVFLFDLDLGMLWPVFLIGMGLLLLFRGMVRK
jgi:hypothetical protein